MVISDIAFPLDRDKPLFIVLDAHGTMLESTWKAEFALAYARLTAKSFEEASRLVDVLASQSTNVDIVGILSHAAKITRKEAKREFEWTKDYYRRTRVSQIKPGILEFIQVMHQRGVPMAILSGSERSSLIPQLREHQLLDIIPPEMVVCRDDVALSNPRIKNKTKTDFRRAALKSLVYHFPDHRLIYFNDCVDGLDTVKAAGGVSFCLPQGMGHERELNRDALLKGGADIIFDGWHSWRAIVRVLNVPEQARPREELMPVSEKMVHELAVVLPAHRETGIPLFIEVNDDLKTLTYYEVTSDAGVFLPNGEVDYGAIRKDKIITFPSSYLISPERYMKAHFQGKDKERVERIWPQGKRYTRYRGIVVSWDRGVDKNVWTTNIDTVYLHKCLEDSKLLDTIKIKRAVEVGTGGGHLSVLLAVRIPWLQELSITDISLYALRAAKRNILPYLNGRIRLRAYLGKGLGAIQEDKADIILINPPYIPTSPYERRPHTDPYRGTGLIREALEHGIYKLNPRNPEASIQVRPTSAGEAGRTRNCRLVIAAIAAARKPTARL